MAARLHVFLAVMMARNNDELFAKVGSKMTKQSDLQQLAGKRIGETLELLEFSGMSRKEIDIIRKAMWRLFDELILNKKVGENDKANH